MLHSYICIDHLNYLIIHFFHKTSALVIAQMDLCLGRIRLWSMKRTLCHIHCKFWRCEGNEAEQGCKKRKAIECHPGELDSTPTSAKTYYVIVMKSFQTHFLWGRKDHWLCVSHFLVAWCQTLQVGCYKLNQDRFKWK